MRCPFCGEPDTQVKDSRPADDHASIRRRRICPACGARFTTYERAHLRDVMVLKKSGKREAFDPDKLGRSLRIAMRKRPVPEERVERLISGLARRIEAQGEAEITSRRIGEMAMEALAAVDAVAYVRFASVYKDFREAQDFEAFVAALRPTEPPEGEP